MNDRKVAVVAIGGNSLIKDKYHRTAQDQYKAAQETCAHIAGMVERGWTVAITHGNGPQVGFILRRSELAAHELPGIPLDNCVAETQGELGYTLQQNLYNEFRRREIKRQVITVVTQVQVDANDPAFTHPSKPIGSFMDYDTAMHRRDELGWQVAEDAGRGWRRVVPSPHPVRIVELDAVYESLQRGHIVIVAGGGGVPVIEDDHGHLRGTAAVIDKDHASSLLARSIYADLFLISTAIDHVYLNFGQPNQAAIKRMTVSEAQQYVEEKQFAAGSMRPKIQAIIDFVRARGAQALITSPENIERALDGQAGTWIIP